MHSSQIKDLNENVISKKDLKVIFKNKQRGNIIKQVEESNKLNHLRFESFDSYASYFCDKNIEDARLKFRFRTKKLKNIPANFKNQYKYKKEELLCEFCPCDLTQEHLLRCPKRSHLRRDLNLYKMDDIITYIKRTIE